jgi:hypothetical protein
MRLTILCSGADSSYGGCQFPGRIRKFLASHAHLLPESTSLQPTPLLEIRLNSAQGFLIPICIAW